MNTIGQMIREAIALHGISLRVVAKQAGLGEFALDLLARDNGVLPCKMTIPLAEALKVDPVTFYSQAMLQYRPAQWQTLLLTLAGNPITAKNLKHVETLRQLGGNIEGLSDKDFQRYSYALNHLGK